MFMSTTLRSAALASLAVLFIVDSTAASAQAVDPVQARGDAIRDSFVAAVRECGVEPTVIPEVAIRTAPSLATYSSADRTLYLSRFEELPPPIQGTMTAWAADGVLGLDAQGQFAEIFNTLVVPHELGHALQFMWVGTPPWTAGRAKPKPIGSPSPTGGWIQPRRSACRSGSRM